jgi:hypothetical protein
MLHCWVCLDIVGNPEEEEHWFTDVDTKVGSIFYGHCLSCSKWLNILMVGSMTIIRWMEKVSALWDSLDRTSPNY